MGLAPFAPHYHRAMYWWSWAAGLAWVIYALFAAVFVAGVALTVYLALAAVALAAPVVCLPIWFVGQFWYFRSPMWAIGAALYAAAFIVISVVWGWGLAAVVIYASLSALSARAAWELNKVRVVP